MTTLAVIPARYASSRLPGKPLLRESGKFLIQHVVERVEQASRIDEVVVATDDRRILDAVASFGGTAVMTADSHRSGTDRVAEVVRERPDADVVVNVQGDEPCIAPAAIDALVELIMADDAPPMATLATAFPTDTLHDDPAAVKVVCDRAGRALYFSRAAIPHFRDPSLPAGNSPPVLLHLGLYAWRRDALLRLAGLPPTPLETAESLEQLRALENGIAIGVGIVPDRGFGIDTRADYDRFLARLAAGDC